jgi:hypothetical protein
MDETLQLLSSTLAKNWDWSLNQLDSNAFQFTVPIGHIYFNCYAEINSEMKAFLFRAILPMPIREDYRQVAMKFISHINYDLPVGYFAMNLETGDCRWKSGIYFGANSLTESLITEVINSSLVFLELYYHGLVKISIGKSLDEALKSLG